MQTKSSNWVPFFIDFASVSAGEIERAVNGEQFDARDVLASFSGVAVEEIAGEQHNSDEWGDDALAA